MPLRVSSDPNVRFEHPDPMPHEAAVTQAPPTMREIVAQYVRQELGDRIPDPEGHFDEEDDFEEPETEPFITDHQFVAMAAEEAAGGETLDGVEDIPTPSTGGAEAGGSTSAEPVGDVGVSDEEQVSP